MAYRAIGSSSFADPFKVPLDMRKTPLVLSEVVDSISIGGYRGSKLAADDLL